MKRNEDIERMMRRAPRVRLGDYIERCSANNSTLKYGVELIEGVNSEGVFCKPKANTEGINLKPYKLVYDGYFVYNPSRLNIGSFALRKNQGMCLVSHLYVVFKLNERGEKEIEPEYLYLYCTRKEFYRQVTYLNFGSQRPEFNFNDISNIIIPLPPVEVQREVVAVYEGLRQMAEDNEALLTPLADACHAYIVDCKAKYPSQPLGDFIEINEETNRENIDLPFIGININKEFMPTSATTESLDKRKYKIMRKGRFVFSGMQTGRDVAIRVGLYNSDKTAIISPAYTTFHVAEEKTKEILPEFLNMQFARKESDRLGWFYSDASVRSNLDWNRFCDMQIPVPPIEVQEAIVALYRCAEKAKKIAAEARALMRDLCPALVQRAANSNVTDNLSQRYR